MAEHRFAEEGAAELDPVKPADQRALPVLIGAPAFNRMGVAGGVEAECGALDLAVDPRLVALGAGLHHGVEGAVAADLESVRADSPGQ